MKRNYGKSFVLIQDRSLFLELPSDYSKRKASLFTKTKKEDIAVPKFTIIPKPQKSSNESGLAKNYIRINNKHNLPAKDGYEMDEIDLNTFQEMANNYECLTKKIFLDMLYVLDREAQQRIVPQKYKLNSVFPHSLKKQKYFMEFQKDALIDDVYKYWSYKRKTLHAPPMRMFWSVNSLGTFKTYQSRENLQMTLRTQKKERSKVVYKKNIHDELTLLRSLLQKIVERESKEIQEHKLKHEFMKKKYLELLAYQKKSQIEKEDLSMSSSHSTELQLEKTGNQSCMNYLQYKTSILGCYFIQEQISNEESESKDEIFAANSLIKKFQNS